MTPIAWLCTLLAGVALLLYLAFRKTEQSDDFSSISGNMIPNIRDQWWSLFKDFSFSTIEFYDLLEKKIEIRKVPDLIMKRLNLNQGGIFSGRREYLRITRKGYSFDVCAAPYGTGFFVSWWFGSHTHITDNLGNSMGAKVLKNMAKPVSYYELDSRAMFMATIKDCISEAITSITAEQGYKAIGMGNNPPQQSPFN